ncbi:MAG: hypothetical protein ABIJ35_03970 [Acidobacteriota bacterium]
MKDDEVDTEDSYREFVDIVIKMAEEAAGSFQIDLSRDGRKILSHYFYRKRSPILASLGKKRNRVNDLEENIKTLIVTALLDARMEGLSSVGAPHIMNAINSLYPTRWPFGF